MEFKKITLHAKQKKRHRCTEQILELCGRRRGWDVQREQHWNKYTIKGETDHQPRLDAWDKCSGLEDPEVWEGEGGERGSGWGTHVNPCLIHVNVWQKPLQYCKVISLQLIKINEKKIFCSKSFKLVFSSTWTMNFQVYKLDLEKAEEPEIKLLTYAAA